MCQGPNPVKFINKTYLRGHLRSYRKLCTKSHCYPFSVFGETSVKCNMYKESLGVKIPNPTEFLKNLS